MDQELGDTNLVIFQAAKELCYILKGKEDPYSGRQRLGALVEKLQEFGLDNKVVFKAHTLASSLFRHYLKRRDGKETWEKRENTTFDKVFEATHEEYLNLKRLAEGEEGDPGRGFQLCIWLHQRVFSNLQPRERHFRLAA